MIALILRILYYSFLHMWSNYIVAQKRLIEKELDDDNLDEDNTADQIRNAFFQYVFITRNTWVCGSLKHIQTTLLVLPKGIIECIKEQGQDMVDAVKKVMTRRDICSILMCIPVFLLSILLIFLLMVLLLLSVPVLIILFIWNLTAKNGFKTLHANGKFIFL